VYNQGVTALAGVFCALTVAITPVRLQIGQNRSARILVGAAAPSAKIRVWTSLGSVSAAHVVGGRIEAEYTPPPAGPPAYAVVAAWDEKTGEVAVATVELEARTEIPVDTEPGAQVSVTVANHRGSARADAKGHATALVWCPPGVLTAKVTAQDAAGNTTVAEVALDVPTPERVWWVERDPAPDGAARLFAFTLQPQVPEIIANAAIVTVSTQPGVASVTARGGGDAEVIALVGDAQARHELHFTRPEPPKPPPVTQSVIVQIPARFADPRDDLGASVGPRFSGNLIDAAATVEWRHRVRRSRFHLGVDVGALYASGNGGTDQVRLGGAFARVIGEARFFPTEKVALTLGIGAGGALVGERRTPVVGADFTSTDGGPSVGGQVGLLARLGRGVLTITGGFWYTPLLGMGNTILDGGAVSVGYRTLRF
jgi:hypothetical protein